MLANFLSSRLLAATAVSLCDHFEALLSIRLLGVSASRRVSADEWMSLSSNQKICLIKVQFLCWHLFPKSVVTSPAGDRFVLVHQFVNYIYLFLNAVLVSLTLRWD